MALVAIDSGRMGEEGERGAEDREGDGEGDEGGSWRGA
jgi:hypothetical protein